MDAFNSCLLGKFALTIRTSCELVFFSAFGHQIAFDLEERLLDRFAGFNVEDGNRRVIALCVLNGPLPQQAAFALKDEGQGAIAKQTFLFNHHRDDILSQIDLLDALVPCQIKSFRQQHFQRCF